MPLIKHCFLTLIVLCLSFPSHAQKRIKETSFSYLEKVVNVSVFLLKPINPYIN